MPAGIVGRLLIALAAAVIVWLLCIFFGGLLATMNVPIAAYVGSFLEKFAVALAIIAFIVAFFRNGFAI